ncbi:MAG: divalent-cation tolerance protein CutA [Desulfovibrionaceae bacterium]
MKNPPQALLVYITVKDALQGMAIAKALVEQRLAACVTILPAVQSVFHWDSAVQCNEENVLLCKSTQDHFENLCTAVCALHSYTTPCVVAVPIVAGNPDFLQWVYDTTHLTS